MNPWLEAILVSTAMMTPYLVGLLFLSISIESEQKALIRIDDDGRPTYKHRRWAWYIGAGFTLIWSPILIAIVWGFYAAR